MANLVIFDIDGTLTTFQDEEAACFDKTVLKIFGVSEYNKDWGSYKNVTFTGFVNEIAEVNFGRPPTKKEFKKFKNAFCRCYQPILDSRNPSSLLIPGAAEIVDRLKRLDNLQLAIATGNWRSIAQIKLDCAGIDSTGIPLSTCSDAISREEIMKNAALMGTQCNGGRPFDKITYVGDGEWDAKASRDLSYYFIGITTNVSEEIFENYGVKAVFEDFTNPDEFIANLF